MSCPTATTPIRHLGLAIENDREGWQVVRANKGTMMADFNVYLRAGMHELAAPLVFDAGDSGTNEHYVNYMAYNDEQALVSGGKKITGWTQVAASRTTWPARLLRPASRTTSGSSS